MTTDERTQLPSGFVYADRFVPHCQLDAKYATNDNFLGRPASGYYKPYVVMTEKVAIGCAEAAQDFFDLGLVMRFFDSYRPQVAVDDFVHWCMNPEDNERKAIHYPKVNKADMLKLGYIASRSGHTRGCAVDLTLVRISDNTPLEMGTIFDFMDIRSHHGAEGFPPIVAENRQLLCDIMCAHGFKSLKEEWWHYSIKDEPYPGVYFNFEIK